MAGQIARACAVFCVDEIVVFDDGQAPTRPPEHDGYTAFADPNFFLYHLLSYLETPPHLRRRLFPMHPDLRTAGALPSVDMPHHLRSDEACPYREGIVTEAIGGGNGVYVDCGLDRSISVPDDLEVGTRLTVQMKGTDGGNQRVVEGTAVSPDEPREVAGYFWGYNVRQASSLSDVFTECPHDGGYDISIGTSERGISLAPLVDNQSQAYLAPTWNHLLVVFGGVAGLEVALSADSKLLTAGVKEVSELFDYWINLVPRQGSRTIRTEEAVWVGLTALRPIVDMRSRPEE